MEAEFSQIRRPKDLVKLIPSLGVKRALDLGCGRGQAMAWLFSGVRYVGLDVSLSLLKEAKLRGPVVLATGEALPFKKECFDLVLVMNVLHHLEDPSATLSEANRCLKEGGYLLLLDTVEDDVFVRIGRRLYASWEGVKVRCRFYAHDLTQLLHASGFEILKAGSIKGFPYSLMHFVLMWPIRRLRLNPFEMDMPRFLRRQIHWKSLQGSGMIIYLAVKTNKI